ncbi:MAG: MFS transporter [Candidatus Paceibacterota bacterium]
MKKYIRIIYLAGFLFTIPLALTSYINSSLLEQYIHQDYVGLLYVSGSIVAILGMLRMPNILNRFGLRKSAIIFSSISFLSLIFLSFSKIAILVVPAFLIYFIVNFFLTAIIDIFIEDLSSKHDIGTFRGLYLSLVSISWVLSQVISGSIIAKSSFLGIYLFSGLFILLVLVLFITNLHNFVDLKYKKVAVKNTLIRVWKNKDILKIYLINLNLRLFYSWMIIYMTLYLHENIGFSFSEIGTIYAIMLTPFVFLSYPLGHLSDKMGEKKMLIYGFVFITFATLVIPFIESKTIWLFALVLFISRIGAATIEVMSESYFFKNITEEDVDEIAFFRNTGPMSFIIGPALATISIIYIPDFSYIFFLLGVILLVGMLIAFRLRDIK